MSTQRQTRLLGSPQPAIAIGVVLVALLTLGWSYSVFPIGTGNWLPWAIWGVVLGEAIIAASRFPIHIDTNIKNTMGTVPLFMLALLLPPIIAGGVTMIAVAIVQTSLRSKRGLWWSDIATMAGRLAIVVTLAASFGVRLKELNAPLMVILGAVAAWMFVSDVLTFPLALYPVNRRPPLPQIFDLTRARWRLEVGQYLLGMAGFALVSRSPWMGLLLLVPMFLVHKSFRQAFELQESTRNLLLKMADLVDQRDPLTEQHSRRVAELSATICDAMHVGKRESEMIVAAARVHDIGKMGIADAILNKPGPLNDDEWLIMKSHVAIGASVVEQTLSHTQHSRRLVAIILDHHERWDGQGYPRREAGTTISLGGRILAVADSFDVMTSDRPYRARMSEKQALSLLQQGRGTQWDPAVVDAFLQARQAGDQPVQRKLASSTLLV